MWKKPYAHDTFGNWFTPRLYIAINELMNTQNYPVHYVLCSQKTDSTSSFVCMFTKTQPYQKLISNLFWLYLLSHLRLVGFFVITVL